MYKGHVTTNKHGIANSMASLFQLNKDIPDTFIVDLDGMTKDAMIITLQSPHMRHVLNEVSGGLQSDTVEGVIDDPNYEGNIDIHFTSAYDEVLLRWVPVLTSIIFGRSKTNFRPHWRVLFQAYEGVNTWDEFMEIFPGITMDWSEAEGESFLEELVEFSKGSLHSKDEAVVFLKKCSVHFKCSVTRIVHNGRIIQNDEQESEFRGYINTLTNVDTTPDKFVRVCNTFASRFPKAVKWISWYLHPRRAASYFPACQTHFNLQERTKHSKLCPTTNAQENIGKQFQELFMVNRKMTLNEAVLNSWKFANCFQLDREAAEKGLSIKYSMFPSPGKSLKKNKKRVKNDGHPPDTTKTLNLKNSKTMPTIVTSTNKLQGITWVFCRGNATFSNTRSLDSFLMMLYVPYYGGLLCRPYPDLDKSGGLLSRTFAFLKDGKDDDARMIWIEEILSIDTSASCNLWGSTDRLFGWLRIAGYRLYPLSST